MTLKITKVDLKRIIREEIEYVLSEINPYHSGKGAGGGRFSSKEKASSTKGSYSLTKNADDDVGKDGKHTVGRGKVTSSGKFSPVYGMASGGDETQCGRMTIDGAKKKKTRRCGDYKKGNYYWVDENLDEDETTSPVHDDEDEDDREAKKKATIKRNQNKNKNDLIPRQIDSPSVRKGKVFPGAKELSSLANGIYEEDDDINSPSDDIYIRNVIKQELQKLHKTATPKQKQLIKHCGWADIMKAIRDIELATNPPKPK